MKSLPLFRIVHLLILPATLAGCAARLQTMVEVYNPPTRLAQLRQARGNSALTNVLETEMTRLLAEKKSKCAGEDPADWLDLVIARLNSYHEVTAQMTNALQRLLARQPAPVAAMASNTLNAIRTGADEAIRAATNELATLKQQLLGGQLSLPEAHVQIDRVLADFQPRFQEAVLGKGNMSSFPPEMQRTYTNTLISLPRVLQQAYGKQSARIGRLAGPASTAAVARPKEGVVRPDTIMETYTDTLLNLALTDPGGWTNVPAATKTIADGNCQIVLVRDGEFSFSTSSLHNDPSGVMKARVGMANSALRILAKAAAMYAGVPAPAPAAAPTPVPAAGDVPPAPPSAPALSGSAVINLARDRDRRAQDLLSRKPANDQDAKFKDWVAEVNALLTPTP